MRKPTIALLLILLFLFGCQKVQEELNTVKDTAKDNVATKTQEITDNIVDKTTEKITDKIMGGEELLDEYGCNITSQNRAFDYKEYYTGQLIDTHVHMPVASKIISDIAIRSGFEDMPAATDVSTDHIYCLSKSEGITKTFGFFIIPNIASSQAVNHVKNIKEKYPDVFVRFLQPPLPIQSLSPKPLEVTEILGENPALFQGYGEARFDFPGENAHPEDQYFLEMYKLSDEHNLIVQMHPKKGQIDALQRILEKYPNVTFLVHVMPDHTREISELMSTHKNLYYSLDAEIHYIFGYQTIQNNKGPTREEYIKFMNENFDMLLQEALQIWKPIIEAHPDQFTWGSDRWYRWHFDPEVSGYVVEFGRTFIGHLDLAVQEKIAYQNAEKMLNGGENNG